MEIFGDLERLLSEDLYPYRWPLSLTAVAVMGIFGWLAWRAEWIARARTGARRRPLVAGVSGVLVLAVVLPTFWALASPLWTRTTLVESSPLELAAATAEASAASVASAVPTSAVPTSAVPTEAVVETATPEATPAAGGDAVIASTAEGTLPRVVLEGEWSGADDFHFAEGRALIIETAPGAYTLRVEDFSVRNGPDLFVYVSPDPLGYSPEAVKLGALKATDGAFNYEIPSDVPIESIRSAVVWCDAFAVLFGSAPLE
ncbi:MAG: DM13 domain-containing protein [Dehalococcoidia bacterium]|nr:DM13 domain-containing protein [Dehalococcoidia bacterium]